MECVHALSLLLIIIQLLSLYTVLSYVIPESEIAALKDIYDLNDGASWAWKYPTSYYGQIWNFTQLPIQPCNWQGIYCANHNHNVSAKTILSVSLAFYNLNGIIPSSISNLSSLLFLELVENKMKGSIPVELCSVKNLSTVLLTQNSFTGTIPPCLFQNLTFLHTVSFMYNKLHGPIPPFVSDYEYQLSILSLNGNQLTGSIPPSISRVTSLVELYIGQNLLTGTIDAVANLLRLTRLSVNNNGFYGTISAKFGNLLSLEFLYLHVNSFHGPIPESFGNLTLLSYLTSYENLLSGTLPQSMSQLTRMQIFIIDDNYHTGSLPYYIGNWMKVQQLAVYANSFNGLLPSSLSTLPRLNLLLLQENFFTGSPAPAFNRTIQKDLTTIDIASNKFTGEMPREMFGPQLEDFSSFATCFAGSIPEGICEATAMQRLSLDGIRSQCAKPIWSLFPNGPKYISRVLGSIPDCIWTNFPNLTMLHVSSNGLTGTIPTLPSYANLSDLDLSFNSLRGTIPFTLQSWNKLTNLDLQNNKFSGNIAGLKYLHYSYYEEDAGVSLSLSKNRLSGVIPVEIGSAENINIVDGNLFSCTMKHQPPYKDTDSNNYVCGSNLLDISLWVFLSVGIVATAFVVMIVYLVQSRLLWHVPFTTWWHYGWAMSHTIYRNIKVTIILLRSHNLLSQYLQILRREVLEASSSSTDNKEPRTWRQRIHVWLLYMKFQTFLMLWWRSKVNHLLLNSQQEQIRLPHLYQFLISVRVLRAISIILMLIVVGTTLPLFPILKWYFGTYKIQYRWTISGAFLSGSEPSMIVIGLWFVLIFVMCMLIHWYIPNTVEPEDAESTRDRGISDLTTSLPDEENRMNLSDESDKPRPTFLATTRDTLAMKSISSALQFVQKRSVWVSMLAFVGNIIVVLILKAALVSLLVASDTSFGVKVLLEVCISGVDLMWGAGIVPYIINSLPHKSSTGRMLLKTAMLYINSIIAPCVVIALADSSCFKGVLINAEPVDEEFTFSSCVVYDDDYGDACMESSSWTSVRPYTPTFLYNYNCYSTVLIEYIPIFMISYSFLTLAIPVASMVLLQRKRHWLFMMLFPGVYYVQSSSTEVTTCPLESSVLQNNTSTSVMLTQPVAAEDTKTITDAENPIQIVSEEAQKEETHIPASTVAPPHPIAEEQCGAGRKFHIQPVDISVFSDTSIQEDESTIFSTTSSKRAITTQRKRQSDTLSLIHRPALFPAFILASTMHHIIVLITFGSMCPALSVTIAVVNVTTSLTWETLLGRWLLRDEPISPYSSAFNEICFLSHQPNIGKYAMEMNRVCRKVCCSPRKSFPLIIFGTGIFFALGTLDMAGDEKSWKEALWAPITVMVLSLLLYIFFDVVPTCWEWNTAAALTVQDSPPPSTTTSMPPPGEPLSRSQYTSNRPMDAVESVVMAPFHANQPEQLSVTQDERGAATIEVDSK